MRGALTALGAVTEMTYIDLSAWLHADADLMRCKVPRSMHCCAQTLLAEDAAAAPAKKKKKKKKKKGMSKEEMIKAAAEAQAAAKAALEQGLSHEDAARLADEKLKVR